MMEFQYLPSADRQRLSELIREINMEKDVEKREALTEEKKGIVSSIKQLKDCTREELMDAKLQIAGNYSRISGSSSVNLEMLDNTITYIDQLISMRAEQDIEDRKEEEEQYYSHNRKSKESSDYSWFIEKDESRYGDEEERE